MDEERERRRQILLDLLPSPPLPASPEEGPTTSAGPSSQRYPFNRRKITVNDLRNRVCWICQEGDEESELQEERRNSSARKGKAKQRRFVHPCKCTLIAHESCLLQWIHRKSTPLNPKVTCPQCAHPYDLYSPKSVPLQIFEHFDKRIRAFMPLGGATLVTVGALSSCACYGYLLVTMWMGKHVTLRKFGNKWPWHSVPELVAVPGLLAWLKTPFAEDWGSTLIPSVLFIPLFRVQMAFFAKLLQAPDLAQGLNSTATYFYPPGPAVTLMLIPWAKMVWRNILWSTTRFVLKPFIKPRRSSESSDARGNSSQSARPTGPDQVIIGRRRIQVVVAEPTDEDAFEAADPLLTAAEMDGDDDASDERSTTRIIPEEAIDAQFQLRRRNWTLHLSPTSMASFLVRTLGLPFLAIGVGEVLQAVAFKFMAKNNWLERLLGLQSFRAFQTSGGAGARPSTSSSAAPSQASSRLGAWAGFGTASQGVSAFSSSGSFWSSQPRPLGSDGTVQPGCFHDGVPSLHWRNAIAACLCVVGSDLTKLAYRYMRLRQRTRTRVVDRPFEGNLIAGLDLR